MQNPLAVVFLAIILGTFAVSHDNLDPGLGSINLYLFEDDWNAEVKCADLTPIACLNSRAAIDTSRLHCGRFRSNSQGNLLMGEDKQLGLLTQPDGPTLLGLQSRGPTASWTTIGPNAHANRIPRDFLRVEVPERGLLAGPRWYISPRPATGNLSLVASESTADYSKGPLGLCFEPHPG
ncbi:hypothetical protein BJX68DRAFT_114916 [Aspergillus pseudodeflectus]|uniref:Secreted protein n=1 Tax=Aspergillus pseudodeflectus TaxID=176178 RepID=A0ABR4L732_9EURO